MVKKKNNPSSKKETKEKKISFFSLLLYFFLGGLIAIFILFISSIYRFEQKYNNKIYPGVKIDNLNVGGKTPQEVETYFQNKNLPLSKLKLTLFYEENVATISGNELSLGFDDKLAGKQTYLIGRSGHFFSDIYQKIKAFKSEIDLTSVLNFNMGNVDDVLTSLASNIDQPAQDGLFQFENGKVLAFKPSATGRQLNKEKTKEVVRSTIVNLPHLDKIQSDNIPLPLTIETVYPKITTDNSNKLGIKELLGVGSSTFFGSISGRIHNIELAASRIHGHLIPPGGVFSFNNALGDVSSSTGFQTAYIIKDGRTVLGDGGGVCQVSTTLFRTVLNSGLPIVERHPHSYRVSYYEQNSGPGFDATVYSPSYDLKFKNDTENYILIQGKPDIKNYSLVFEIYGTKDGRNVEISKPILYTQIPPPADLYQDDPTIAKGVVKQVDWKAWGAKVSFKYKVSKQNQILSENTFYSNYQPWQSVFLRGTKE